MPYSASLSSPSFNGPSLASLALATRNIALSTARLTTGNRLINAGDDVAALSIAARLQSQVSTLKSARGNASQGASFLQVAYSGLTQVRDVLDRMNALATQASSGSLTNADRAALQLEFSALNTEINRLAGNTKFGEIELLNGSTSGNNRVDTTTTAATKATGTLTFSVNPTAGQTVVINGQTLVADTDFVIGGTEAATVANLAQALTDSTNPALSGATYSAGGTVLTITQKAGGTAGNQFIINQAGSTAAFATGGATTNVANVFTLSGGADDGLGYGSARTNGSVGDSLVTAQSQIKAETRLNITGAISDGETLRIDNGNGGFVDFTFRNAAATDTEIQIGASTEETLQNAASVLSQYSGTDNFGVRQLEFQVDGDALIIRNQNAGNPTDLTGANLDVAETLANGTLTLAALSTGTNTGVDTSGVVNADFIGSIQGFSATYNSADNITASITVGSSTYTATIADTTPATATKVRFSSSSGGYFDVQIAAGGAAVANQTQADNFATRLNTAFATLDFTQSRIISDFSGTGTLVGAKAEIALGDFSEGVNVEDIRVSAPVSPGGDAVIEIDVNGETFRSVSGLGGLLGENEAITLESTENTGRSIRLTAGSSSGSDFSDATLAQSFEDTLKASFGLGSGGSGLNFQVGQGANDNINVVLPDARTDTLFGGASLSIDTQGGAEDAQDAIADALALVNEGIATIGALQSRFDYAFNNLENTRINVDIARGALADTDIAEESTRLAGETLKANIATAVIAQTNKLQASLLETIRFNNA